MQTRKEIVFIGLIILLLAFFPVYAAKPTVSISASPKTIVAGGSSTLTWTSTGATSASINNGVGTVPVNGSIRVTPTKTTTYTITARNSSGSRTASATVSVTASLPTVSISAEPRSILLGEFSTLSWTSANTTSVYIDQDIGEVDLNGSVEVFPLETTTYLITASNSSGSATASVTVAVSQPQPQVSLIAFPSVVLPGESANLCWRTEHVDSASIDNGVGEVAVQGFIQVTPATTITYTIIATGPGGATAASATVEIDDTLQPSASIYSSLKIVKEGGSIMLSWDSAHAESAEIDNGIGSVPTKGSLRVTPGQSTTYTITTENRNGTATASVKVELKSSPRCYAYVPNNLDYTVSVVNTNYSGTIVKTIPVGEYPSGCAVAKDGMRVYISNGLSGSISAIDTGSNSVVSTIEVPGIYDYLALHPGGRWLYAQAWRNDYAIVVIDTKTGQEVEEIDLGGISLQSFVFHPDGSRLYAAGGDNVLVIDTISNEIMFAIPVPSANAIDLAISHDGNKLYVIGGIYPGPNVFVIDLQTNLVIHSTTVFQTQSGQTAMLWAGKVLPDDSRLYVTADEDPQWKKLSFINTSTFGQTKAGILQLYSPKSLAVHPNGSRVFIVGYYGQGVMSIFGTSSNAQEGSIGLGQSSVAKGDFVGYMADSVAGKVTQNNTGVAGVTLTITGEGDTRTVLTDASGNYCTALKSGTYTVTPSKENMVFSPQSLQVTIDQSVSGKDFKVIDTSVPPTVSLTASPATIQSGGTATLSWTSTNTATAAIDNNVGTVPANGFIAVTPGTTTTYTITVSNTVLTATATALVTVTSPQPTAIITALPATIVNGGSSILTWTTANAITASIDNGVGVVPVNGSVSVSPTTTTTYTITATGAGGSASVSVKVTVQEAPPTVTFIADPEYIPPNGSSTLTWTTKNATSVSIDQGIGAVDLNGSLAVSPLSETIYTLTAIGPGGTTSASVTVKMLDAHLRAIWSGMKEAMISGNIDQAASNFCEQTREDYKTVYTNLFGQLAQIAQEMGEIEPLTYEENVAIFRIKRNDVINGDEQVISYRIYFFYQNGAWLIYKY